MSASRTTTALPGNLKDRIAALQQRGTSPNPQQQQQVLSKSDASSPPRGTLRDKIARFEEKGGTPIPRGSFGLGAPPPAQDDASKKRGELWGNRIKIGSKPGGRGPPASRSNSFQSSSRQRCVSASFVDFDPQQLMDSAPPSPSLTAISGVDEPPSPTTFSEASTFSPSPRRNSFAAKGSPAGSDVFGFYDESVASHKALSIRTLPPLEEPVELPSIVISQEPTPSEDVEETPIAETPDASQRTETVKSVFWNGESFQKLSTPSFEEGPSDGGQEFAENTTTITNEAVGDLQTAEAILSQPIVSKAADAMERGDSSLIISFPHHFDDSEAQVEHHPILSSDGALEVATERVPTGVELPFIHIPENPREPGYNNSLVSNPPGNVSPRFHESPTSLIPKLYQASSTPSDEVALISGLEAARDPLPADDELRDVVEEWDSQVVSLLKRPTEIMPPIGTDSSEAAIVDVRRHRATSITSRAVLVGAPVWTIPYVEPTPEEKVGHTSFSAVVYGKTTEFAPAMSSTAFSPARTRSHIVAEPQSPGLTADLSALLAEAVQMEQLLGLDSSGPELSTLASSLGIQGRASDQLHRPEGLLDPVDEIPPTPPPKSPGSRNNRLSSFRSFVGGGKQRSMPGGYPRHRISSSEDSLSGAIPLSPAFDLASPPSPKKSLSRASSLAGRILSKSTRSRSGGNDHSDGERDSRESGSSFLTPSTQGSSRPISPISSRSSFASRFDLDEFPPVPEHDLPVPSLLSKGSLLSLRHRKPSTTSTASATPSSAVLSSSPKTSQHMPRLSLYDEGQEVREVQHDWASSVLSVATDT